MWWNLQPHYITWDCNKQHHSTEYRMPFENLSVFFIQSIEYFFKVNGWWSEWNGNWGVFQPRGFPIIQRDLSIIPRDRGSRIVMWWKSHVVFFCWNDVLVTRIWLLQLQSLNLQECELRDWYWTWNFSFEMFELLPSSHPMPCRIWTQ